MIFDDKEVKDENRILKPEDSRGREMEKSHVIISFTRTMYFMWKTI
jgi:hypothetical protein